MSLPLYKVVVAVIEDGSTTSIEVEGNLEVRQLATLVFTDDYGVIVRSISKDYWIDVKLIR